VERDLGRPKEKSMKMKSIWAVVAGVLAVLAIPQCWAGGKIYELQSAKR
jgi:hypothetical protein